MNDNRSIELKSLNPINQGITSPHSYPKVDSPHQYPTAQTEAPQVSDCTAYESLPCDKASDRSGAPLVLKQEKYNPVYGSGGGATSTSFKGNASKKPPLPYRSNGTNKRRSSTIACVAASVILCLALLVSIAAILLAIFMILGLIPLPTSSMSEVSTEEPQDVVVCVVYLYERCGQWVGNRNIRTPAKPYPFARDGISYPLGCCCDLS